MVSGIEGVGEAVTGGMLARTVEPEAGEATEHEGGNCLNCGAELTGPYCQGCGQKGHVHRTLGAFWHDIVHGVFHFEGKIWRTLPLLAWRPGELTRRYIDGERAKFVSPVALFLFSVFMMFAVFSLIGGPFTFDSDPQTAAEIQAEAERDFRRDQAERQEELTEARAERQRLAQAGRPTAEADAEIRALEQQIAVAERIYRETLRIAGTGAPQLPGGSPGETSAVQRAGQTDAPPAGDTAAPPAATGEQAATGNAVSASEDLPDGLEWLNAGYRKAKENPALLAYKLQTNAYKFSWALIPISVPFVWLLFLHRRRYRRYGGYDHTVFVTYSIAFMSLALIMLSLLRPLGLPGALIGLAIVLVPPVHMYRQLRGAYSLSRWSALWRTLMLLLFAFIAATLFFLLLVTLGALG